MMSRKYGDQRDGGQLLQIFRQGERTERNGEREQKVDGGEDGEGKKIILVSQATSNKSTY